MKLARIFPSTLHGRIIFLSLFITLPAIFLMAYNAFRQRDFLAAEGRSDVTQLARLFSDQQERLLTRVRQVLITLSSSDEIRAGGLDVCKQKLISLVDALKGYDNFSLIDPNGNVLCSTVTLSRPVNIRDRAYFQRFLATGTFTTSGYLTSRITGKTISVALTPVFNDRGQIKLALAATIAISWMKEYFKVLSLPSEAIVVVVNRQGVVVHSTSPYWIGKELPGTDRQILHATTEGVFSEKILDGTKRIYGFSKIKGVGGAFFVIVGVPPSLALAKAESSLALNLSLLGVALTIAFIGMFFGSRSMLHGFSVLKIAAGKLANGDFDVRTGVVYDNSEIGNLARSFDFMAEELERRHSALQQSEQRFRRLASSTFEAIIFSDGHGGSECHIVDANTQASTMLGYGPGELLGLELTSLIPVRQNALEAGTTSDEDGPFETHVSRKDGSKFLAEIREKSIDVQTRSLRVTAVRDLSERERAKQLLLESNSRLAALIQNLRYGILIEDVHRRVVHANPRFCHMFGISETPEALVGANYEKPLEQLQNLFRDPENFVMDVRLALQSRHPLNGKLLHLTDGRVFERDYIPIRGNEIFVGHSWLYRDVTERVQAEVTMRNQAEDLKRYNKELQDFAYVASHDLQEPLRKIQAFGGRLVSKYEEQLDDDGRRYLYRMTAAADRMQTLIQDLLAFSRITTKAKAFDRVNLNHVLTEVLEDLETRLESTGARLDSSLLPVIDADPTQMRQLFQNLLGNAIKFQRKGQVPEISIDCLLEQNNLCQIMVKDNGIGFEEKYLDRIFNPFQRLHGRSEYEGTGIGLAICRKIVERHGGTISAKSQPGQGTVFIVALPVSQQKGQA